MAPSLARRMACFLYEALILFGLGLVPGIVGAIVLPHDARPAWANQAAVRAFAFAFYGLYFVGFWSRRGQTLPMQTWHIRLETPTGVAPGIGRALARYCCAWVWIAPPALAAEALHWRPWPSLGLVAAWIVAYAGASRLAPGRQFWHDLACGTRLVPAPPLPRT